MNNLFEIFTIRQDPIRLNKLIIWEKFRHYYAIKGKIHYLPENSVKYYMHQLIKSIDRMHRNEIFHGDIKSENILLT